MTGLDPAVRDLLVAISDAVDAAEHPDEPVFAIAAACRSAAQWPDWDAAAWLRSETAELADRRRVKVADTRGMLAEDLVPVRPTPDWAVHP